MKDSLLILRDPEFRAAFRAHEAENRISTGKVAALLVAVLMPFGSTLDLVVYPQRVVAFGLIRLASSVLAACLWYLLSLNWGKRHHRVLGLVTAWLPSVCICWMIYDREGPASPYYAGLNLVLLAISLVVRWNALESAVAVGGVILMYLITCLLHGPLESLDGRFLANCIFMVETGVIVVVGNHFFNRLRLRDFASRYELAQRKHELEAALAKLREAEAQLVQQEKMASLGVLSAGIIHEINNPLNFAMTNLFALRKHIAALPPAQQAEITEILSDIEDGLTRVKNIVSDLRLFTHPDSGGLEPVNLQEAVQAALRYLSGEMPESVRVEVQIPPGFMVKANRNKLVHVLINLVENSLDALRLKSFGTETPCIRITAHAERERIRLQVWDNGPGIAPEHLPRVFDPFFTTKDVGQGTGLGLSICYRLLQECQGTIQVQSEPGRYCLFTLEFPATPPQPDAQQTLQA